MKTCSNCGANAADEAKFCPSCGEGFENAAKEDAESCPECGAAVQPGAKFCPSCGAALAASEASASEEDWEEDDDYEDADEERAPAGTRNLRSILLPIIIVPVLVGIFYMLSLNDKNPQPHAGTSAANQPAMDMDAVIAQLDSMRAVLKENPKDTTALLVLAQMYNVAGKYEEARDYYGRYLEVSPGNIDVQLQIANIYFQEKNYSAAYDELQQLIKKEPANPYVLYNYALTLHMLGDIDGAVASWQKVAALDPDGEIGKQAHDVLMTVKMMRENK